MARALPLLAALLLGVAASVLVACGAGTKGGIPAASADAITQDLDQVDQAVRDGECAQAVAALTRVRGEILNLPASTSPRLRARLQDGARNLAARVPGECAQNKTESTTTETTPTDTTPTTTTNTTPTTTTNTTPTTTNTTPTTTTNTTPTTTTNTTPTTTTPTTTTPTTPTTPATGGGGTGGGASAGTGSQGSGTSGNGTGGTGTTP